MTMNTDSVDSGVRKTSTPTTTIAPLNGSGTDRLSGKFWKEEHTHRVTSGKQSKSWLARMKDRTKHALMKSTEKEMHDEREAVAERSAFLSIDARLTEECLRSGNERISGTGGK